MVCFLYGSLIDQLIFSNNDDEASKRLIRKRQGNGDLLHNRNDLLHPISPPRAGNTGPYQQKKEQLIPPNPPLYENGYRNNGENAGGVDDGQNQNTVV